MTWLNFCSHYKCLFWNQYHIFREPVLCCVLMMFNAVVTTQSSLMNCMIFTMRCLLKGNDVLTKVRLVWAGRLLQKMNRIKNIKYSCPYYYTININETEAWTEVEPNMRSHYDCMWICTVDRWLHFNTLTLIQEVLSVLQLSNINVFNIRQKCNRIYLNTFHNITF